MQTIGDPVRLTQVLSNLVNNALKFTERGHVLIALDMTANDKRRIRLRVRDTGIGIPADKLEAVFEPFVQLVRGSGAGQEGSGLGLSISRELARAMGGDLTAESALGAGSTFTLTLPRPRPAAPGRP